jgi:sulfotransferase
MNRLFILGGLPRSGITLLSTLLNQNPEIYTTTTSPFVELLWRSYSLWDDDNFRGEIERTKIGNIKTIFLYKFAKLFFTSLTSKPIVIDKRRHWQSISNIKMYEEVMGERPKIICPVRSVDEIVASFLKVFKRSGGEHLQETVDDILNREVLGTVYADLMDTFNSEYRDCILFVEYDSLVDDTTNTLKRIYNFLGVDYYEHNITNGICATELEGDYGLKGLHDVRPIISKNNTVIGDYLSDEQISKCSTMNFWRDAV